MAGKVVVHDSGAVRIFAGQLRHAAAELEATASSLSGAAHSVRGAWRDPQQEAVQEQIDQMRSALGRFRKQAEQTARYCDGIAAQVEALR